MSSLRFRLISAALCLVGIIGLSAQTPPPKSTTPDWVRRSNEHTRVVLQEQARVAPEAMAAVGLAGLDDQITDLSPGYSARVRESVARIAAELSKRRAAESDLLVRQDLDILIEANTQQQRSIEIAQRLLLPYMVEHGVSQARAIFAFNSTNVEGWGLYAEYIVKPFIPREGQLISLQHRLLRAARAFSDPELQMGRTTPDQVKQLLMNDVMLSDAMATQEVERYTFRAPGQATSYFYGYSQLLRLRNDVEQAMGAGFSARQFHDFVLAQGLLPPALLRTAVMNEFVAAAKR